MKWVVANVVSSLEYISGKQEYFPVEEEMLIFSYKTKSELLQKIKSHFILTDEMDRLYLGGKPARKFCHGIRKSTLINKDDIDNFTIKNIDGIKISSSKFKVKSVEDAKKIASDNEIDVLYMKEKNKSKFDITR